MFYLTERVDEKQCSVGDRLMVLSDFSGIPAGLKGTISEIYHEGVMVEWDVLHCYSVDNGCSRAAEECSCGCYECKPRRKRSDGFSRDDLQYLAFETKKRPDVDPTVTNIHADGR